MVFATSAPYPQPWALPLATRPGRWSACASVEGGGCGQPRLSRTGNHRCLLSDEDGPQQEDGVRPEVVYRCEQPQSPESIFLAGQVEGGAHGDIFKVAFATRIETSFDPGYLASDGYSFYEFS
jgi:hypothetical protein